MYTCLVLNLSLGLLDRLFPLFELELGLTLG